MRVLVTGGAGYLGSTIALALLDAGDQPVVVDNLSRGPASYLRHFTHYVGDFADAGLIARVFADHPDIDAVVHCAARTVVTESLEQPALYYRENVAKTVALLRSVQARGVERILFSSTAAVYGTAPDRVITEATPVRPASPYARSKLMVERVLADLCATSSLTAVSMRYFNPIGADPRQRTGPHDPEPTDVMGTLLTASTTGEPFWIHGDDWPTGDGTPVRDFLHVWDLALAHVAALHRWDDVTRDAAHQLIDIGSGHGTTVRQLADEFNRASRAAVEIRYDGRRPGDIAGGYASAAKARDLLRWQATRTVAEAVRDAVAWADLAREGGDRR